MVRLLTSVIPVGALTTAGVVDGALDMWNASSSGDGVTAVTAGSLIAAVPVRTDMAPVASMGVGPAPVTRKMIAPPLGAPLTDRQV